MATQLEDLYERDVVAWTRDQAAALRLLAEQRWNGPLDLLHLADEIESVGSEIQLGVESQVSRVIEHLLKLEHSPMALPRQGWLASVDQAREAIEPRLTATIRARLEVGLAELYTRGRRAARRGLLAFGERPAVDALPSTCPYTLDQVLADGWYPASRHGLVDEA